jgi:hypothetical protein
VTGQSLDGLARLGDREPALLAAFLAVVDERSAAITAPPAQTSPAASASPALNLARQLNALRG